MNQKYLFVNVKLHLSGSEAPFPKLLKHVELNCYRCQTLDNLKCFSSPAEFLYPPKEEFLLFTCLPFLYLQIYVWKKGTYCNLHCSYMKQHIPEICKWSMLNWLCEITRRAKDAKPPSFFCSLFGQVIRRNYISYLKCCRNNGS